MPILSSAAPPAEREPENDCIYSKPIYAKYISNYSRTLRETIRTATAGRDMAVAGDKLVPDKMKRDVK